MTTKYFSSKTLVKSVQILDGQKYLTFVYYFCIVSTGDFVIVWLIYANVNSLMVATIAVMSLGEN